MSVSRYKKVQTPSAHGQAHGQAHAPSIIMQTYNNNMSSVQSGTETEWMLRPVTAPGCPAGLEYLTQVDHIIIQRATEQLEGFVGIEGQNRFLVKNTLGQHIYHAAEESHTCERQLCGPHRGFNMHMVDNFGEFVMKTTRDFKCFAGICWCSCLGWLAYDITVEAPLRSPVGYVRQSFSLWKPVFDIKNERYETILQLKGPGCICKCSCMDMEFGIYTREGVKIGSIKNKWPVLEQSIFSDAQHFGVTFPMDLDVKLKATLLAAVFMINMMYFEHHHPDSR